MNALIHNILRSDKSFERLAVIPHYPLSRLMPETLAMTEEETAYCRHPWSHVDFVIFNRISHRPVLLIEVDGVTYHAEGTRQAVRDAMKDKVLSRIGLRPLRLATTASGEESRIRTALQAAMGASG
ncbi:DUF2726 domain-containing protein [Sutterella sp.]|uniref:DUF2726 domain-containing protein n=1 Tax=Sutterella sp. TaxID=1981025 RepID=UPI0026E03451|nr:DUF2726 domain-containing protein [Sutterella sp.]MDO5532303.1 DUF2726 domain-containing protein [Sutterella sp.]